jgi:hypothetical protein
LHADSLKFFGAQHRCNLCCKMRETLSPRPMHPVGAGAKPDSAGAKPDIESEQNRIFDFDREK